MSSCYLYHPKSCNRFVQQVLFSRTEVAANYVSLSEWSGLFHSAVLVFPYYLFDACFILAVFHALLGCLIIWTLCKFVPAHNAFSWNLINANPHYSCSNPRLAVPYILCPSCSYLCALIGNAGKTEEKAIKETRTQSIAKVSFAQLTFFHHKYVLGMHAKLSPREEMSCCPYNFLDF